MMNSAIQIRDLCVRRGGKVVLEDIDLDVPAGQLVGLLGPSGGGKTTLMRAIVGLQAHVAGDVSVLGKPAGSAALRREVGYVTQSPSVYRDLTVRANLRYFAGLTGGSAGDVQTAIERVDLTDKADTLVGNLSGGQASRVSLAAALVGRPRLLILDEPTVGLDPVLRRDLWTLFAELSSGGATLLVSSHVMDEATRCNRLVLLRQGRLLADDTLAGLLDRTGAEDAEAAFLALIDQAEGEGSNSPSDWVHRTGYPGTRQPGRRR